MKINVTHRGWFYLVLLLTALFIQVAAGPALNSDDEMYAAVANSGDIFAWLVDRYSTWSSRSLIDLVTILLVTHTTLWMLLNAIVIASMCFAISSLASKDSRICLNISAFVMACFWLIPANMMHWSVWWVTGSINYLWPITASLCYWAVVKYGLTGQKLSVPAIALGFMLAVFSSFNEQVMVVNFIVHVFLFFMLRRDYFYNKMIGFGLLANFIGFAFFILCDGNAGRLIFSARSYFPEFLDMSFLEKAYFGISLGLYQFFYIGSWVSIIFCAVIALRYNAKASKSIAMISLLFIMLTSGYMLGYVGSGFSELTDNIGFIGGVYQVPYRKAFSHDFIRAMGWGIVFSGALTFALLENMHFDKSKVYRVFLFVLSFIPSCMLGFSPTMYVSQERVLFASVAIILLLIAIIAGKTRYSWHLLAATSVVAYFTYS
ncbi:MULTISPECIES: DUF6056 family protein [unclassified Halomonas]|uniref:DUF6056 family protein n=1 Tax=unclassified Halomonas TaxID=2609666 RepID=UPI0007DA3977|nr:MULTISPECIES: DUF6056 family protein [unclassified Halomonas]MBT2787219.1 hypothetical protein [Halomonas sp. ISL-106]MBT2796417.1 hypothetical protein [Halomonas sp. ISL-104]OAL57816.1 hypothetical protein A6R74_11725 [Halomonas sp. ALS9]